MQFVLPWKKGVASYESEFSDLEVKRPERCPHCGCAKFHKWGKYERYVVEEDGDARIPVRRIRCVKCGGTFSYLPSFCLLGICYSADFVMAFLKVLLLKIQFSLGERKRQAYAFLRRFARLENLWLTFLRAKGFGDFPADKRARLTKIFAALLEFHRNGSLSADFLRETGRRLMSVK